MPGIRWPSLSNKTVESRDLYFPGKRVMGFRGREGVLSMAVNASEERDDPVKKPSMPVSSFEGRF